MLYEIFSWLIKQMIRSTLNMSYPADYIIVCLQSTVAVRLENQYLSISA